MPEQTFLSYFITSNPVVQVVMVILLIASVISWAIILQKWFELGRARVAAKRFEKKFWKEENLDELFLKVDKKGDKNAGLAALFREGYQSFKRLQSNAKATPRMLVESAQRSTRASIAYDDESLSAYLSLLATIGSISPFIGLFGTVWGIMMSFHALGSAAQVTIAMVAPGIAGALIATAMGLFAAIPAVIFYNRYVSQVDRLLNRYEAFQDQFLSLLQGRALSQQSLSESAQQETDEAHA